MTFVILRHCLSFIFSVVLSFYMIFLTSRIAQKFGILDFPDGKVKKQSKGVPYLGGLAVFIPFIATLSLFYPFQNSLSWLLLGTTQLLLVGLLDDLIIFRHWQKLLGQMIAVTSFLRGGFALRTDFFSAPLSVCLSGFWVLFVINAFNLVDVMDGLSSLISIVAAVSFLIIALFTQQYFLSLLLVTFLASLIVFFIYNKPPARIYLGDCGSLFVGGFLAAVPLLFSWSHENPYGYIVPVIILGVPLMEVVMLIVIRTYKKIPFYMASPHHFSSYLQLKGWEKNRILFFVGVISISLSVVSILFLFNYIGFITLSLSLVFLLIVWLYYVFGTEGFYK